MTTFFIDLFIDLIISLHFTFLCISGGDKSNSLSVILKENQTEVELGKKVALQYEVTNFTLGIVGVNYRSNHTTYSYIRCSSSIASSFKDLSSSPESGSFLRTVSGIYHVTLPLR